MFEAGDSMLTWVVLQLSYNYDPNVEKHNKNTYAVFLMNWRHLD